MLHLIALAAAQPPLLAGSPEGFGVGMMVGLPTGLSFAWRTDAPLYGDLALAYSFDRKALHVHGDALYTISVLETEDLPDILFPVYIGLGPRFHFGEESSLYQSETFIGLRVPLGMGIQHDNVPLEGFLEMAPGIGLYPETRPFFDVAVGARFYL